MEQNPSIGELMAITNSALIEWTNRSLSAHGYDKEALYSYDVFGGKMLNGQRRKGKKKILSTFNLLICGYIRGEYIEFKVKKGYI